MTDAGKLLSTTNEVLSRIAAEQKYEDYETDVKLFYSGGANYTSQLFLITLSAPGQDDLKLFAKVAVISEKLRTMSTLQVFETEIMFYTEVVTRYRALEERYNFPQNIRMLLPKYYGGSTEYLKETLVLEELSVKGYQPFDRFKCFDWEYASTCVGALARLHALSVAFERDEPEQFSRIAQKIEFQFGAEYLNIFMEKSISNSIEATDEEHRGRFAKFLKENMTESSLMLITNPTRKIVLYHGDFRPSNILHRKNKDGNLEVVIIDYQVLQKGNPLTDLIYFLVTGSDEEFREKHMEQYFERYYEELCSTLRLLEIDPDDVYKKEEYDEDVKQYLPYGLIFGVMTLPIVTVDESAAPKVEDGIDLESFAMEPSELFRTRLNGLVRDWVNRGLL